MRYHPLHLRESLRPDLITAPMDLDLPFPPLYLIVDSASCVQRTLENAVEEALEAGIRLVQLREKQMQPDQLRRQAEKLAKLTAAYDARLAINAHPDIAVEVGAGGVHLPASGPSPESVRRQFGRKLFIGCSAHTPEELERAAECGDFATYSPVYPTPSKPDAETFLGIEGLGAAASSTDLPLFALGGITPERAPLCRAAGAAGVAMMSGILGAEDIASRVGSYLKAWENSPALLSTQEQ